MSDSLEIRGTRKQRIIGKIAGWIIRIMGWTLRYRIEGLEQLEAKYQGKPVIYALWHNRIFAMPYTRSKLAKGRELVVLTSASKDGAILENAVSVFNIGAVRGSSSRRGAAALVALRKKIKAGASICITPDGPRGPRQKLQPGIVKLAQASGAPILAINVEFSKCKQLKTWDQFRVPWPFSKVYVKVEDGIDIPRDIDQSAFEQQVRDIELLMNQPVEKIEQ